MQARFKVGGVEALLAIAAIVTALVVGSFFAERAVPGQLLPHGVCFSWLPALLWLHVISDSLIGLAYLSIPIGLVVLVRKRRDLPLNWMFLLFSLFIVSCGLTHLIGVWTIWNPHYWFAGSMKAITAAASVLTAVAMIPALPRALRIPTSAQLQQANSELEREVARRQAVEEQLLQAQAELERRVEVRTRDLNEARAYSERLRLAAEQANDLKDRFLAKVSHELRTPLQAMLTWSAMLSMQLNEQHAGWLATRRIADNVRAQARLIDDLLDISRILSGKLRLELKEERADEILARALDAVEPAAQKDNVRVVREFMLEGVTMVTDADRLEQVIWNLVTNAVRASKPGAEVHVSAQARDDDLVMQVRDDGVGIDPEDMPRLFEPFQQGQTSNGHRGLGLGLAISRSIVSLLGGAVSAQSEGRGRGAVFRVTIPLSAGSAVRGAERTLDQLDLDVLRDVRVLYVEDNEDIAESLSYALRSYVAEIRVAHSMQEALTQAVANDDFVLISDINLGGGGSGHDLLAQLRGRYAFSGPALALSAYGEEADRSRSLAAGFAEHLVKPVTAVQVALAIVRLLRTDH